ncbi:MAG: hypothetical protein JNM17_07920 [Archangium sp.]|nr:hypothetical protein [Archangium sp.]
MARGRLDHHVTVDLIGTSLEKHASAMVLIVDGDPPSTENKNIGGASWLKCELRDTKFIGAGDPARLGEILTHFKSWAESH